MSIDIFLEKNSDFKIMEGAMEWVNFKYIQEPKYINDADATLNGTKFEIRSKTKWWWIFNVGSKKVDIFKSNELIGHIYIGGWNGIMISIPDPDGVERIFELSIKGNTSYRYILKDDQGRSLFEIRERYKLLTDVTHSKLML